MTAPRPKLRHPSTSRRLVPLLLAVVAASLAGCTNSQQKRLARHCPACKVIHVDIASELSPLVAITMKAEPAIGGRLHIYLEGDGRPWNKWNKPSPNPNSHRLTALELMQIDRTDSIYLNRPCYGAYPMASGCENGLWTSGRYSETVVTAMNAAIDKIQEQYQAAQLVFIGHSGGGTLAMLLAERRADVAAVITLAANLDHRAWTHHFRYLPLSESLSAAAVELPTDVLRWHFAAVDDQQVPAELVERAAAHDPFARVETIQGLDHSCCWPQVWPAILQELNDQLTVVAN